MLDAETKRRIDTARDILVGKVPDPKSQVEQITIALIYKFMDDMDRESVEMGGKRSFFIGEYEKYSWSNIFNPRLGGHEMLNLYAEAITRMSQSPHLPELFRNIFKNAYLPYRDPETLKLFLKTINEFTYDHSERLGDAFEYLLSVLGSQGDAGQFRTPRHIIDFMVEIISPKKNELILDPACGTAGFLISAYKYIMRENTSEKYRSQNGNGIGDLLNTEEKKKLLANFKGYDISPDMVRISLVNMYLHGFVSPQIYEYDTLTSEDRWNEYADVILANPPFMTPKGGIKPHKRFSVQSNRSEVLFVDYIAEHLTPTGRAAVIVPEGIIFQSAKAYKQLRKMLVENYLYAVVSLPKGVFEPYSGVKTSILLMDKVLAKKTDSILFVKIENDGFDLGAQRRPIDRNDLPDALQVIREYMDKVRNGKADAFHADEKPCGSLLVKKEKLAENGEYNLTGDRYRVVEKRKRQKWPMVKLGEVCELIRGITYSKEDEVEENGYPVLRANNINLDGTLNFDEVKQISKKVNLNENKKLKKGDIFICLASGSKEHIGKVTFIDNDIDYYFGGFMGVIRTLNNEILNSKYLFLNLKNSKFNEYLRIQISGVNINNLNSKILYEFQIPLPPLEVQQEIVAEIEGYQKIIDGCKQVIDAWKPDVETYLDEELKTYLAEHPEKQEELAEGWPMVKLGEVFKLTSGKFLPQKEQVEGDYLVYGGNGISGKHNKYFLEKPTLIIGRVGEYCGSVHITMPKSWVTDNALLVSEYFINVEQRYLLFVLTNLEINKYAKRGGQPSVSQSTIYSLSIPLPPLEVQQRIVDKIEAERKVMDSLREMVKTYEEKIKRLIDKVWGE